MLKDYILVQEGKPAMSEYDDTLIIRDFLEPDISLPIQVGVDFFDPKEQFLTKN